jgi:hypothetical protein
MNLTNFLHLKFLKCNYDLLETCEINYAISHEIKNTFNLIK